MKVTTRIKTYSDPQHGWAKVSFKSLLKLGLVNKITGYSYVSKCLNYVFLEEDHDLTLYVNALKERNIEYKFIESWTNNQSRIRNYASYAPVPNAGGQ